MHITIRESGALTTVQDAGRYGYQGQGIPLSGAMSPLAMKMANILVGNPVNHPVIECIGTGPEIEFSGAVCFAVCGGSFRVFLNEQPIETNRTYRAEAADLLKIANAPRGRSCVIAFSADFVLPAVYGSWATDIKSGLGPNRGGKLQAGTVIELTEVRNTLPNMDRRFFPPETPDPGFTVLRVIEGPNAESFSEKGRRTFYENAFTVSLQSDKMGFRLEGPAIETVQGNDIISSGLCDGAIQVTPDAPIMMMKNHATTGGYAVIAAVISADFSKASQLMPGDRIRFRKVSLEEAQEALRKQNAYLLAAEREFSRKGILGIFRK